MKLHLGCGKQHLDGFVNIDRQQLPGVDRIAEIDDLPFEDNEIDEIYASHCIEHFSHKKTLGVLKEWHRVLKPDGILNIATPDLEAIIYILINAGFSEWILNILYGDQNGVNEYHYTVFNEGYMRKCLTDVGFKEIQRVANFGKGLNDCSSLMFTGINPPIPVSLNLTARK